MVSKQNRMKKDRKMKDKKKKIKDFFQSGKWKEWIQIDKIKNSPKAIAGIATAGVLFIILIVVLVIGSGKKEEVVYRETTVEFGELTVGITESSSVDMETVTQSFDLDISALIKNESTGSSSQSQQGQQGQMGQPGQMGGGIQFPTLTTGSGVSYSSQSANVTVEEILISVGQKVKAGDSLLKLTKESVEEIREQLETDFTEAKNDLNSIESNQRSSKLEAQQNYDSSILYGKYAQLEYDETIEAAQETVETLEESQAAISEELALYEEKLKIANEEYTEAVLYCTNITETLDSMDVYDDPTWYASLEGTRIEAQETVYSLEDKIEQLESNVEKSKEELENTTEQLAVAQRNLEQSKLTAKRDYDLRMLASNTAEESYDVSIGYLEQEASTQQKAYDNAKEKLDDFDSAISEYAILAKEDGVITDISISKGEEITAGTEIVTMYTENVSLTVSLEESDAENVTKDSVVKVSLIAYPETMFEGSVSEISDAQYDSSTGSSYYDITVSIDGSQEEFYQGMTGEITFITKETEEVIYVSNRAITREGTKSYVKMKDEKGTMIRKEVITGFSDGVNVEIKDGLKEGDIVLIESKVSEE